MAARWPESAGFLTKPTGASVGRTLMLPELRNLLAAVGREEPLAAYRAAVIENNVLLKPTQRARVVSFHYLKNRFALDCQIPLFRALRTLWDADEQTQPLLAILLATARDPILRASADYVLSTPQGNPLPSKILIEPIQDAFPTRYSPQTVAIVAERVVASWTQSGHLSRPASGRIGRPHLRSHAKSSPLAATYALYLGHKQGIGGEALFDTLWTRMLDVPPREVIAQAEEAARQGWIELRRAGGVTSVQFPELERNDKEMAR